MEKQLKCDLLLPLKQMTLRRVAVLLWSDSDVLTTIFKFRMRVFIKDTARKEWQETVENKIKDKVLKLELANSLTKQMIDTVRAIGIEIRRWKSSLQGSMFGSISPVSLSDWSKVYWTTAGTICSRKTAEELVNWDKLNASQRYLISSSYCLEDYVPLFLEGLSEEAKELFCKTKPTLPSLHFCWPHIASGELSELDYLYRTSDGNMTNFNQWAFDYSSMDGNKTGAEYFYKKLSHEEREASVMRTAHRLLSRPNQEQRLKEKHSDFMFYLLTLMTPEQQINTIKTYPVNAFLCFLDWPGQDLFLENIDLLWTYLPPSGYGDLLKKMAGRFRSSGHYYPKLFREFFIQSPRDFKKCTSVQETGSRFPNAHPFLWLFLEHEHSESIEVMFRNVDVEDRAKLVFHRSVLELFYDIILKDRWHMVEVCLREATLSKEDMERLKGAFEEVIKSKNRRQSDWVNHKMKTFFDFLDETDTSAYEKKKGLDETDTSAYEEMKGLDETDTSAYEVKKGQKRKLENHYPEE